MRVAEIGSIVAGALRELHASEMTSSSSMSTNVFLMDMLYHCDSAEVEPSVFLEFCSTKNLSPSSMSKIVARLIPGPGNPTGSKTGRVRRKSRRGIVLEQRKGDGDELVERCEGVGLVERCVADVLADNFEVEQEWLEDRSLESTLR